MKKTIRRIAYLYLAWGCFKQVDRLSAWILKLNQERIADWIYVKVENFLYGDHPRGYRIPRYNQKTQRFDPMGDR